MNGRSKAVSAVHTKRKYALDFQRPSGPLGVPGVAPKHAIEKEQRDVNRE